MVLNFSVNTIHATIVMLCVPLNKRSTYSLLCAFHLKMLPLMASFLSAKGNLAFAKDCNGKVKESRSGRGIVVDRNKSVFQSPYLEYQNKERQFAAVTNGWCTCLEFGLLV